MTQVTFRPQWMDMAFFNDNEAITAKVVNAEVEEKSGNKRDIIIELTSGDGHCRFSVWGINLKFMITQFGDNTDKWIGKTVTITRKTINGKLYKVLSA